MINRFEDFLRARWRDKLAAHRVLSIYDPEGRYEDVTASLAGPHTRVIPVGANIITEREDALEAFRKLADDPTNNATLVLYRKQSRSLEDTGWLEDPLAPLALAGCLFPDGPADDYKSLCQQFLPDRVPEIEDLFSGGEPVFAVVNQLVEGAGAYPTLSELLQAEGPKEILVRFLCPTVEQGKKLSKAKVWTKELESLASRTLGFALPAKGVEVEEIRMALWRFLLFSEFAADLPVALPAALTGVPQAPKRHAAFVFSVCETLRDSKTAEQAYEECATQVAGQLQLEQHCKDLEDLGQRDTFAFEERSFLKRFAKLALQRQSDEAAAVAEARRRSFWIRDPRRAAEWKLAGCCLDFLSRLDGAKMTLAGGRERPVSEWARFYAEEFTHVDALYRQMEAVADELAPLEDPLVELAGKVRAAYIEAVDSLTRSFQRAVQQDGWPASGMPRATDIFERLVRAPWQAGKRVAYFWVDALRYDLALLLQELAGGRHAVKVEPACAQLPTFTVVGMAALLPGADTGLRLQNQNGDLAVTIHGEKLTNPDQRFQLVQRLVGVNRSRLMNLDDLVSGKSKMDLGTVEVLVVKTTDIDQLGESNPGYIIRLIPEIVRKLQHALNKLADEGFHQAVLTSDHGFLWFADVGAGEALAKPAGEWIEEKNRCLLGSGQPSPDTLLLETAHVGIRSDFPHYITPRGVATFTRGVRYSHEGLSPQECLIPLVTAQLRAAAPAKSGGKVDLALTYRGAKAGKIHILQPSIEVVYFGTDLFGPAEVRFRLEAFDSAGQRVAQAAASQLVNVETREVTIQRAQALKVPIRIEEGAKGRLEVRASNAETGEIYAALTLETEFHH
jgi:hypothetical protein